MNLQTSVCIGEVKQAKGVNLYASLKFEVVAKKQSGPPGGQHAGKKHVPAALNPGTDDEVGVDFVGPDRFLNPQLRGNLYKPGRATFHLIPTRCFIQCETANLCLRQSAHLCALRSHRSLGLEVRKSLEPLQGGEGRQYLRLSEPDNRTNTVF